jgi:enoyl-CoA hydratase
VSDVLYQVEGGVARLTLNRPERGNGLTRPLLEELERLVERADLDPEVRVLLLSGAGSGFCGGYDLVEAAETQLPNHDPNEPWDPMVDYAMMSRNVRTFMSLHRCTKPVVCKVHGFCVAGGTDLALCSDLLVAGEDTKIGYPPARVWGSPTTAMWAFRLGPQAWPEPELDERVETLVARIARLPLNQLQMMKLLCNQWFEGAGVGGAQVLGTLLDGITRHTREGYAFQQLAAAEGFREAVRQRDEPFGDFGR